MLLEAREWTDAAAPGLAAVEAMLAGVLERAAKQHAATPLVAVHVTGGQARAAPCRAVFSRALGAALGARAAAKLLAADNTHDFGVAGREGGGEALVDTDESADFAAARGAAALAAHRLQPAAVEAAFKKAGRALGALNVDDALPRAVYVEEGSGTATCLFEAYSPMGSCRQPLSFAATAEEQVVRLAEGAVASGGVSGDAVPAEVGTTPLLEVRVPAAKRRASLLGALLAPKAKAEAEPLRVVSVAVTAAGVLEAELLEGDAADDDDGGARPRLGVCGVLLLLLLIVGSLLSAFPALPPPSGASEAAKPAGDDAAAGAAADGEGA